MGWVHCMMGVSGAAAGLALVSVALMHAKIIALQAQLDVARSPANSMVAAPKCRIGA
jgi:hypothetical protein